VLVAAGLVLAPVLLLAAGAGSGPGTSAAAARPRPLPAHVFAPNFETWSTNRLIRVAERSGVRNFTLAFIQAPKRGSCTPTWNGAPGQTMAAGRYLPGLRALRKLGGDVVPSFGGYSADHALTEIADSCTSMRKLVAAYESVVRTYGATRLDMDVEDRSLGNLAGIDRRNKALRRVEAWAARTGRRLQIEYTLPVEPPGLESDGLHVLRNAIRNGTRVDVVNIMTFDYYDDAKHEMASDTMTAADALVAYLHTLCSTCSQERLWRAVGVTEMIVGGVVSTMRA